MLAHILKGKAGKANAERGSSGGGSLLSLSSPIARDVRNPSQFLFCMQPLKPSFRPSEQCALYLFSFFLSILHTYSNNAQG